MIPQAYPEELFCFSLITEDLKPLHETNNPYSEWNLMQIYSHQPMLKE